MAWFFKRQRSANLTFFILTRFIHSILESFSGMFCPFDFQTVPATNEKKKVSTQTFRLDLINSSLGGILEVGFGTFAILIAIRFLQAPDLIKAVLPPGFLPVFLVPHMQRLAAWTQFSASRFCAFLMLISSLLLFGSGNFSNLWILATALFLAQVCFSQLPGFMIQVYSRNYGSKERGKRLSWNFIVSALIGMILSYWRQLPR